MALTTGSKLHLVSVASGKKQTLDIDGKNTKYVANEYLKRDCRARS
jgi:hypothetical protein